MSGTGEGMRAQGAPKKQRLVWLDALRGFTVISMVLFHGMWDAVWLYGLNAPWYNTLPGYVWQQSICWTFIFLAGFSWRFDRKPLKRGLLIFGAGALVTLVTTVFMPEDRIIFGVLTLIGSCILLMIPLDRLCRTHLPDAAGLCIFAALFFLTRNVNRGCLGFEGLRLAALPAGMYRGLFMTYLGFPEPSFFSTDYFSLIPWFFLFCCGYFTHGIVMGQQKSSADDAVRIRAEAPAGSTAKAPPGSGADRGTEKKIPALLRGLCFIGRHAMAVYIIHQPALIVVLEAFRMLRK